MASLRATQVDRSASIIDLAIGQPDFDLLPLEIMRRAAAARLSAGDTELLNYGAEQGDGRFRLALADFLSAEYGLPVAAETLMVTAGASQGLDLLCTLFTRPGDTIFVEEPSYFIALRILIEDHGLVPVALPVDDDGLELDALEAALARRRPAFVYTIPTFQNPTGRTLSWERRERLVRLAREHDFLIVADEVYHPLHYHAPPPPPLASYIDGGHVLSLGSFSKILAPGLRLGWVLTRGDHVERFVGSGLVDSGGGLNHFTSNLVRVALEEGWQSEYLVQLRRTYGERVEAMAEALDRHLDGRIRVSAPAGGYFFWLTLPESVAAADWLPLAREQGVGFLPGNRCSSQGGLGNHMRLSFAHYPIPTLRKGIERLGALLARLL